MKQWIKLETDLMQDAQIIRLISQLGPKGLAAYVMIRLAVGRCEHCSISEVENLASECIRRRLLRSVVYDFGLFDVDQNGQVYARTRPQGPADVPADGCAAVPLTVPSEHNKEKEKENKKRPSVSMLLRLATSPQERAFYQEMLQRFPRVCQMEKVLTYEQLQRLNQAGYTNQQIRDVLQQMENNRNLHRNYVSAYLTLNNWIRKK